MNRFIAALFPVLLLSAFGTSSSDATVTFSGLSGDLAAQADFTVAGNTLTVVLTNTSTADVLVPADLLTAVFFDITGYPPASFSPVSAMLSGGSTVFFGPDGGGNVGGEWVFASGLSGAPDNATLGISSAGFGLFGAGNFNGPNLEGANGVNGLNYGLLSAGDNTTTGNAAVTRRQSPHPKPGDVHAHRLCAVLGKRHHQCLLPVRDIAQRTECSEQRR